MIKNIALSIIGILALIATSIGLASSAAADTQQESTKEEEQSLKKIGNVDNPKKYVDEIKENGGNLQIKNESEDKGYLTNSKTGESAVPFDRRTGDCGSSSLYLIPKSTTLGYNLTTSYRVIEPVIGWYWQVDVYGPEGDQYSWGGGPNSGRMDRTASKNVSQHGQYNGIVSNGYVLLLDGSICGTLNPASTIRI